MLTLLTSPGTLAASSSAGGSGSASAVGGLDAAFMAVHRPAVVPGWLVGALIDADGARACRLALQTREQHIRREKATSNICTAQALRAITASMYAVYQAPTGSGDLPSAVHRYAWGSTWAAWYEA